MRNIGKQTEPNSLVQHRCNLHSDYDNYGQKEDLRESLVREQRGICCYCMQRIRPSESDMKIEHWRCQSRYPDQQLDYSNLLGACNGGHGKQRKDQHCDTRKANVDLAFNPSDISHNVESKFRFSASGRIEASNGDQALQTQLDDVLNLNHSLLVRNRKAVLDSFAKTLKLGRARDCDLPKHLAKWEGTNGGELTPFCQVIVYYLRRKIGTA